MLNSTMSFYDQTSYKKLKQFLLEQSSNELNSQIVTLPGLGISYHLKKFLEKNLLTNSTYRSLPTKDELKKYNFLDLDLAKKPENIAYIEHTFHGLELNQKICLTINNPAIFSALSYKQSDFPKRIYSTYYFAAYDLSDTSNLCNELNVKLNHQQISTIFTKSGGIARLVKFLAQNSDLLNLSDQEIVDNQDLARLAQPLLESIITSPDSILSSLNIKQNGKCFSTILQSLLNKFDTTHIIINPDLSFVENDELNKQNLTKTESMLLTQILVNHGVITREHLGDLLWGQGTYDKFSDQAINQLISRLNKKLHHYKLKNIPKVGYKLESKN